MSLFLDNVCVLDPTWCFPDFATDQTARQPNQGHPILPGGELWWSVVREGGVPGRNRRGGGPAGGTSAHGTQVSTALMVHSQPMWPA